MEYKVKTLDYYNVKDFIQKDDKLEEIAVTITISEYRDLVSAKAEASYKLQMKESESRATIDGLKKEIADLKDQLTRLNLFIATNSDSLGIYKIDEAGLPTITNS